MIDHKVLNLFNSLFASSVRIRFSEEWCQLYFSNTFRNHICPLLLDTFTSFIGVTITSQNWAVFVKHVSYLSSVLRYSTLTLASTVTGVWFLMKRKQYYKLAENLLHFDQCYKLIANTWSIETEASFTKVQIAFLIASHITIIIIYVASFIWLGEYGFYSKILIVCCIFIGFHFMLQQLYTVYFAEHLSERYSLLSKVVSKKINQKILVETLKLYDQLGNMQRAVSEVFGLSCLITTLVVFLNTAIVVYSEMIYLVQGIPTSMILAELVNMIPIMVLFHAIMHSFDKLIVQEQAFKNAVMSHQYKTVELRSEEHLHFLDVINLKLMSAGPRITACGLFTINLRVFNNILAAIVTYIMILFQFQDLEKV